MQSFTTTVSNFVQFEFCHSSTYNTCSSQYNMQTNKRTTQTMCEGYALGLTVKPSSCQNV